MIRLVRRFDGGAKIGFAKFSAALESLNDAMHLPIDQLAKKIAVNKH